MRSPFFRSTLLLFLMIFPVKAVTAAEDRAGVPAPDAATTGTAFLGDVTGSTTAGLNPDEARRLFHGAEGPSAGREVNVPLAAERKRLSQIREALVPAPITESAVRIRALEGFLDYDEADQIIYSPGRTRIRYGQYFLEADRMIYDARLQEVQAEGNVVIEMGADKFAADRMRYNFIHEEGVADNVSGSHPPIYFRPARVKKTPQQAGTEEQKAEEAQESQKPPQFQKVSKQETIFRETQVTSCDFKVPHYSIKAREVVLFQSDRIFLRGATFYAWGIPLFYLPAYTRALTGGSPWFLTLGYNSRAGAYARFGYAYEHQTQEPGFTNEKEYQTRSAGKAAVYVDYLSKIGPGLGFDYRYKFDYGRHHGELSLYNIYDQNREVVGAKPDFVEERNAVTNQPILDPDGRSFYDLVEPDHLSENERWRFYWRHRSAITDKLNVTVNIDQFSDPDVFYDILDIFSDDNLERERQVTRRTRVALTDVEEAFVARLMFEIKDRIGLNRITDYSDPSDDDFDYNLNPYTTLEDANVDGISSKRWGRVSERLPQFDLASRYLPLGRRPLYYMSELNIYNNLDKGINVVSRDDDAYVQGAQFYNRFLRQWKLGERYTLLGKAGFGAGTARRDGEDLGINDFDDVHVLRNRFDEFLIDGVWSGAHFVGDDGTFLVGRRERNFDQIQDNYLWGDAELKLNARFSDTLTGQLDWRYRKTTKDYIGDWYASLGNQTFREDLFNYPIREHWLEGKLYYRLARPILALYTTGAVNLLPRDELYSKEDTAYWINGISWANQAQTLVAAASIGIRRQQVFDPTDPAEYEENRLSMGAEVSYTPRHQRWYTQVRLRYDDPLNGQIERIDNARKYTFFTEQQTDTDIKWIYGRELGPKYNTEFQIRWDEQVGGLRDVSWLLQRDLHDALLVFRVRMRNKDTHAESRTDTQNEVDFRVGLKFKMPGRNVTYGAGDVKTLRDRLRQPAVAY